MAAEHEIDYAQVIAAVRAKLSCGAERIADAPAALRWSWWPTEPDIQDQLRSDYGVATDYSELENEFQSEVVAIRESLESLGHVPRLADWQGSSSVDGTSLWTGLNRSAVALSLWDRFGMPVRRRGDLVFRLWAPRQIMGGAPIIKAVPIDLYILTVAQKTAIDAVEISRLQAALRRWRSLSAAVGAVLLILVAAVLL